MLQRDPDIYASAHLRHLLAEEAAAMAPLLQRCAGSHALLLSALSHDHPPVLPLLGYWTRMRLVGKRYQGDVKARADEPLPFADDAFGLVLLRHAMEVAPVPQSLLQEACRVLAPGGVLAVTGLHPLSAWLPWVYWQRRHTTMPAITSPLTLERWVRAGELEIERVERVGHVWPNAGAKARGVHPLGGAYVLIARKNRRVAILPKLKPALVPAPVNVKLAPGARRGAPSDA
ncbi:SAM-dependent methyltransferase [Dyella sp. SG562]|uniref:class I SAM-dependent methyltransferase n=1 Tax=Dyella TaxID=231454 RepID=UPI001421CA59|nr:MULTISPECIES: methyltransferase domain-containing protein [unclassified Dyella]NII73702.1 SAM-dependent methyltransferase [Dyella sp. SG562]NKJ20705.1 SAM-dependent methyltransferase [Dyella sp. SG609]